MAFNGIPNPPPHPPPPHGARPSPPPLNPFWDFIHSMDPNYRAGYGVDHTANTALPRGFNFGPDGFEAWSGRHGFHGGWGRHRGHGGWPWFSGFEGPWGHEGRCYGRRRHRGRHSGDEDAPSGEDEMMRDMGATGEAEGDLENVEREHDPEKRDSPATMRAEGPEGDVPDPPEEVPNEFPFGRRGGRGRGRGGFGHRGRGGPGGRGRGGHPFGHHHGHHGHHGHRGHQGPHPPPAGPSGPAGPPPPPYGHPGFGSPFDFGGWMNAFADHPFAQRVRAYVDRNLAQAQGSRDRGNVAANNEDEDDTNTYDDFGGENTFVPPMDIFNSLSSWTIHIALPGAKKEDIAINWDAHKGKLAVTGVVYRPGDEEFLAGMVTSERKVGLFERHIALPPPESDEKDEIDGDGISARMEDGVLIVVVPKVEKEWTEVRKVDIQ